MKAVQKEFEKITKIRENNERTEESLLNEIEKVINSVQKVFKEALGEDSKKYLSYSLNLQIGIKRFIEVVILVLVLISATIKSNIILIIKIMNNLLF